MTFGIIYDRIHQKGVIVIVIIIIVLGIFITYYLYRIPIEEAEEKELKREQPVIIELLPKGTKAKPVKCMVNETIYFRVLGYSDYKRENLIEIEGSNIIWHNYMGKWDKKYGIDNVYHTPNKAGYQDIWISYKDKKINTSSKVKILVEEHNDLS